MSDFKTEGLNVKNIEEGVEMVTGLKIGQVWRNVRDTKCAFRIDGFNYQSREVVITYVNGCWQEFLCVDSVCKAIDKNDWKKLADASEVVNRGPHPLKVGQVWACEVDEQHYSIDRIEGGTVYWSYTNGSHKDNCNKKLLEETIASGKLWLVIDAPVPPGAEHVTPERKPHRPNKYIKRGLVVCEGCGALPSDEEWLKTCASPDGRRYAEFLEGANITTMEIRNSNFAKRRTFIEPFEGMRTSAGGLVCSFGRWRH